MERLIRMLDHGSSSGPSKTRLFVDSIDSVAVVDRGANVDANILFFKRAGTNAVTDQHKEREETRMFNIEKMESEGRSVQEVVEAAIEAEAVARYPGVSKEVAIYKMLGTPDGQEMMRLHRAPEAHLPVKEWCARRTELKKAGGHGSWEATVLAKANAIEPTLPQTLPAAERFVAAVRKVRDTAPEVWRHYLEETGGRSPIAV